MRKNFPNYTSRKPSVSYLLVFISLFAKISFENYFSRQGVRNNKKINFNDLLPELLFSLAATRRSFARGVWKGVQIN